MQVSSAKTESLLAAEYLRELEAESRATRECLKNVSLDDPKWKPHEKSMEIGYLAILVADIPRWIKDAIETGLIDFATWEQATATNGDELVALFDRNMEGARKALQSVTDEGLKKTFELKNSGQLLMSAPVDETISSSINHMVHHRGQLTVYMRLNDIAVPSIYGPSADSGGF